MKEKYLAKRLELLAQADTAAQAGDLEKFENIKKEIETLDNTYDAQCKMLADMEAMKGVDGEYGEGNLTIREIDLNKVDDFVLTIGGTIDICDLGINKKIPASEQTEKVD